MHTSSECTFQALHVFYILAANTARKKATYDKFGEEGLKGGIPGDAGENGAWTTGYTYHENPEKIFRQFFGGDNPFAGRNKLNHLIF